MNDTYTGNYNASSVKLTRRFSQGVSVITNYTWAKSIDNSSGTRTQGLDILFPQDSTCFQCERSLSSFDVRHRWVLGAVYDLPVGKGKMLGISNSVLNGFVGGWQLSANTTIQSGVPQTLSSGGNIAGTNNPVNDRPSYSGTGNGYLSNHVHTSTGLKWYDPQLSKMIGLAGTCGILVSSVTIEPWPHGFRGTGQNARDLERILQSNL